MHRVSPVLSFGWVIVTLLTARVARADGLLERARREAQGREAQDDASNRERHPTTVRASSNEEPAHESERSEHIRRRHVRRHARDRTIVYVSADAVEDEEEPPSDPIAYAAYPYAIAAFPYLTPADFDLGPEGVETPEQLERDFEAGPVQHWAGQIALSASYLHDVVHGDFDARLLTPLRVELSMHGTWLHEGANSDTAVLLSGALGYRLLQWHFLMARIFVGVQRFGGWVKAEAGPELGLGFDMFLVRPLVLSGDASAGAVGHAAALEARGRLGIMLGRIEVFAAAEYLRIGSSDLSSFGLGTRLWL